MYYNNDYSNDYSNDWCRHEHCDDKTSKKHEKHKQPCYMSNAYNPMMMQSYPMMHVCPMMHTCPMMKGHPMMKAYEMKDKAKLSYNRDEEDRQYYPYYNYPYYNYPYYNYPYYNYYYNPLPLLFLLPFLREDEEKEEE
ncbi:hypothetical protein CPJCM30710_22270 [Clostridium polyendosporum]|uniref:Uncharacterized protein n=1 Tax=Clostridium polyendosporum TaxID=69208 RepID=A0A919S1G7_9CLOT|nr:hypothetical protein [Clostridium polyendosporum]GIM29561.1 hypothetical protein CPJCM30710_22270 [Clostridium polyendosporum]